MAVSHIYLPSDIWQYSEDKWLIDQLSTTTINKHVRRNTMAENMNNQCSTNSGSWIGTVVKTALIFGAGMLAGVLVDSMLNDDENDEADNEEIVAADGN